MSPGGGGGGIYIFFMTCKIMPNTALSLLNEVCMEGMCAVRECGL